MNRLGKKIRVCKNILRIKKEIEGAVTDRNINLVNSGYILMKLSLKLTGLQTVFIVKF